MDPNKALGPDGFNPGFFQAWWPKLGGELFRVCADWLDRGSFPREITLTNVVLIPKIDKLETLRDLRPISLCSVMYRIVAKVLANRLRGVVPKLIAKEQSAFIRGRSITDNVLVAFESLHHMKRIQNAKHGEMAVKIDISKAYDRVAWDYMEAVLQKLGFSDKWIDWMMMCIRSVEYNFVVNSEVVGPVIPGRGLRQGCPLSPFLFLVCAEGLSALMRKAEVTGKLQGVRVCKGAPCISHLLFADDSFFFCRAEIDEARELKRVFSVYERASGQAINFGKSRAFFSKNTHVMLQEGIRCILGIDKGLDTGKYLGLPSMVGRKKKAVFAYIKDRVWERIQGWRGRPISQGGKEVLVKAVLQAIPTYCMTTFLIPSTLAAEIQVLMNSFWWGRKGNGGGGISWLRWERLCVRKEHGGMNFRDLTGFNLAMLGKQGWKFISDPDALVSKVFKAKYFPKGDFLTAKEGKNPSLVWKSIWSAQHIVGSGVRWKIGDGTAVNVWSQPWLRSEVNMWVETPMIHGLEDATVSDFLIPGLPMWDEEAVRATFDDRDADCILQLPLSNLEEKDTRVWHFEKNGIYSVRSAYRLAMERVMDRSMLHVEGSWNKLWTISVPPKVKNLVWRLGRGVVPTRAVLHHRGIVGVPLNCGMCEGPLEDAWHVFFGCTVAKQCWATAGMSNTVEASIANCYTIKDWILRFIQTHSAEINDKFVTILWSIWGERNARVWSNKKTTAEWVVKLGLDNVREWQSAQKAQAGQATTPISICSKWHPPKPGIVKCNVDVALFDAERRTGFGRIARDSTGGVIHYSMASRAGIGVVKEGEGQAISEALAWMEENGIVQGVVESDAQGVVRAIQASREDVSELGDIVRRCRRLLDRNPGFEVCFVRRVQNKVAHELARRSCSCTSPVCGVVSPSWLHDVMSEVCFDEH
ncbi:Putative ribonuclease H protein At1g65750 [Linum perenne]